jgi:hypothetical protein
VLHLPAALSLRIVSAPRLTDVTLVSIAACSLQIAAQVFLKNYLPQARAVASTRIFAFCTVHWQHPSVRICAHSWSYSAKEELYAE